MPRLSRRQFLAAAASTALLPAIPRSAPADKPADDTVAFFLVSDTHFLADKADPKRLDPRSAAVTGRLVDTLNRLPGTAIPAEAGGGTVRAPRGVLHGGDCIDSGDKAGEPAATMQATEWAAFADAYGLTGKEGRLRFPVYEVHGNHDSPRGDGLAVKHIIARNKGRAGLAAVSPNGLHYSWDWGPVHFVNLGIVVGQVPSIARKRRYAPLDSLDFLKSDLRDRVGTSGRPVVVMHHVDMLRYSRPLPIEDALAEKMEWDPADVHGYHEALAGHRLAAVFYGHTHARNVYHWDGTPRAAARGVPTFNVDNSSHFAGKAQAFFYFEITGDKVLVREYSTDDAWQTAYWTPQTWRTEVASLPASDRPGPR